MKNRRNYCSRSDCIVKTFLFYFLTVILTTQCVLRELIAFFQSEFSRKCELVLTFSVSSVFSFPSAHPAAAYVFFLVFPSLLSFGQERVSEGSTYANQVAFLRFIVSTMFLSSFTLCNTSFVTRSVELVFSNLLQQHIPKLPRYV